MLGQQLTVEPLATPARGGCDVTIVSTSYMTLEALRAADLLANHYYPRAVHIVNAVRSMMGLREQTEQELGVRTELPLDVPDKSFTGPF